MNADLNGCLKVFDDTLHLQMLQILKKKKNYIYSEELLKPNPNAAAPKTGVQHVATLLLHHK